MNTTDPTDPQIVLGTMDFGTRVDADRAFAILDSFVAHGGVWLDTANCYSFWADPGGVGGAGERRHAACRAPSAGPGRLPPPAQIAYYG